jgi:uncharacterized repeat protein (TIGR03943 family)
VLLALGAAVLHTVVSGDYTSYVRPIMQLPLFGAAVALIVAGAAGLATGLAESADPRDHAGHEHAHGRSRVPRAALLALVPLAVLAIVRPAALDDGATESVAPAAAGQAPAYDPKVAPLPGGPDVARAMTFSELSIRAAANGGPETLRGRLLTVEGFVAKSQKNAPAGTVRVGRYKIWCCAADATFGAAFVRWPAGAPAPTPGAWFTITARVTDTTTDGYVVVVLMDGQQVRPEGQPKIPYEY